MNYEQYSILASQKANCSISEAFVILEMVAEICNDNDWGIPFSCSISNASITFTMYDEQFTFHYADTTYEKIEKTIRTVRERWV